MAFQAPSRKRLATGFIIGVLAFGVFGGIVGWATAAAEEEEPVAVDMRPHHVGDRFSYQIEQFEDRGEGWDPTGEGEETYQWGDPATVRLDDDTVARLNTLHMAQESPAGLGSMQLFVVPASHRATAVALNGVFGFGFSFPGTVPGSSLDVDLSMDLMLWGRFTVPCTILPDVPERLDLGREAAILRGCITAGSGDAISASASVGELDGKEVVVLRGSTRTTLADVLEEDEQDSVPTRNQDLLDRPLTIKATLWLEPGNPYPVRAVREYHLSIPEDRDLPSAYRLEWNLQALAWGDGAPLLRTHEPVAEPAPNLAIGPRHVHGPDETGIEHPFPLSTAFDAAASDPEVLGDFMAARPGAYVAQADLLAFERGAESGLQWTMLATDGDAARWAFVSQTTRPVGSSITQLLPADAPAQETVIEATAHDAEAGVIDYVPPGMVPDAVPTAASILDRWDTYRVDGLPDVPAGWGFSLLCADPGSCDGAEWQTWAGASAATRPREFWSLVEGMQQEEVTVRANVQDPTMSIETSRESWQETRLLQDPLPAGGDATPAGGSGQGSIQIDDQPWVFPAAAAVAGLGFLGLLAGALYTYGPNLKAALLGFTRIRETQLLDHPVRRSIYQLIEAEPGIHMQEIRRRVGTGVGNTRHHLDKLEAAGMVVARVSESRRRFFVKAQTDRRVMDALHQVRSPAAARILEAIHARPGGMAKELAANVGLSPATVSHHLKNLEADGLVRLERRGRSLHAFVTPVGATAAAGKVAA